MKQFIALFKQSQELNLQQETYVSPENHCWQFSPFFFRSGTWSFSSNFIVWLVFTNYTHKLCTFTNLDGNRVRLDSAEVPPLLIELLQHWIWMQPWFFVTFSIIVSHIFLKILLKFLKSFGKIFSININ